MYVVINGYSVGFMGRIIVGFQRYICNCGSWIKIGVFVSIFILDGYQFGSYIFKCDLFKRILMYVWKFFNFLGIIIELGYSSSGF